MAASPQELKANAARKVLDLRRALHAEPGSAEALRLAALRGEHVSAPPPPAPAPAGPAPAAAPHHHTFDAVMQHHALRTHATVHADYHYMLASLNSTAGYTDPI